MENLREQQVADESTTAKHERPTRHLGQRTTVEVTVDLLQRPRPRALSDEVYPALILWRRLHLRGFQLPDDHPVCRAARLEVEGASLMERARTLLIGTGHLPGWPRRRLEERLTRRDSLGRRREAENQLAELAEQAARAGILKDSTPNTESVEAA
jgi:hypothetical protein